MPARRIRENGREKCRAAYRLADNLQQLFWFNKKIAASGNLPSVSGMRATIRHHWRPQTRQRPIGHVFARYRQRPGFMHPSSIGRVQNNTQSPISSRHRSRTRWRLPGTIPSRCVARQSTPEYWRSYFLRQPRGNSPGKERAIRQQMKKSPIISPNSAGRPLPSPRQKGAGQNDPEQESQSPDRG